MAFKIDTCTPVEAEIYFGLRDLRNAGLSSDELVLAAVVLRERALVAA